MYIIWSSAGNVPHLIIQKRNNADDWLIIGFTCFQSWYKSIWVSMFVRDRSFYTEQNEIKWNGYRLKHPTLNRRIYCVFGCFTTRVFLRHVSYHHVQACVKTVKVFVLFFSWAAYQQFFMTNQQMISCKFKRRRHHEPRKKPKTCIIWVMYMVDLTCWNKMKQWCMWNDIL